MNTNKAVKPILWSTAVSSTITFALAWFGTKYMYQGGEPYFPLYHFLWDNQLPIQWIMTITSFTAPAAWLTLAALRIQKANKSKPTPTFTKDLKFREMRTLALIIAAIPGLGLIPFGIAITASQLLEPATFLYGAAVSLAFISMPIIFGGPFVMFGLLVAALAVLAKKPINPEAPAPQPQLTQIFLAILTTAFPTIAFILIWLQTGKCDPGPCGTLFESPIVQVLILAYALMWLVLGAIWLKNRKSKTTA